MRKRTLVYMVIEWDDANTRDPRKWDWQALVQGNEGTDEQVLAVDATRLSDAMTETDIDDLVESIRDASSQAVRDAAAFEHPDDFGYNPILDPDEVDAIVRESNRRVMQRSTNPPANPSGWGKGGCVRTNLSPSDLIRGDNPNLDPRLKPGPNDL